MCLNLLWPQWEVHRQRVFVCLRVVSVAFIAAERELVLIRLRAAAGPARTELLQLADIFRAKVVDVSERSTTLQLVGDPGKV